MFFNAMIGIVGAIAWRCCAAVLHADVTASLHTMRRTPAETMAGSLAKRSTAHGRRCCDLSDLVSLLRCTRVRQHAYAGVLHINVGAEHLVEQLYHSNPGCRQTHTLPE